MKKIFLIFAFMFLMLTLQSEEKQKEGSETQAVAFNSGDDSNSSSLNENQMNNLRNAIKEALEKDYSNPQTGILSQNGEKKKICLNMIIKNESKVITRCFDSVLPFIDYWVIVDTGSTDDTIPIVKNYMKEKGIPGELHETPWRNFEYNRNDALQKAKGRGDYLLIIDADETLDIPKDYELPKLDKDYYHIITKFGGTEYARNQLINNHLDWKWVGVLHEYLDCPQAKSHGTLERVRNVVFTDGARSTDPLKYQKDAELLEKALESDPTNVRYVFYLAQSYKDFGNKEKALENYRKRAEMGGWDEEVYWSKLQIAKLLDALDRPRAEVIKAYTDAYQYRNTRPEAIYYLAEYYRRSNDFALAYLMAETGRTIPPSKDVLFVEKYITDWGMDLEYSINAFWTFRYDECQRVSMRLLEKPDLPEYVRNCVENNLKFNRAKLFELYMSSMKQVETEKQNETEQKNETGN